MEDKVSLETEKNTVLDDINDDFSKWINEHFARMEAKNTLSEPIYHYTDAFGIDGILKNQEMWFTSYQHLNDPTEIHYGLSVVSDVLSELSEGEDDKIQFFCKQVQRLVDATSTRNEISYFISSFSRNRDDLGQWRGYGDNGRGFAIGLAPHLFHIGDGLTKDNGVDFAVIPVVYGKKNGREVCLPTIEKAIDIFRNALKDHQKLISDQTVGLAFLKNIAINIASSVGIVSSMMIKHQAYENEKEVRLVTVRDNNKANDDVFTRPRRGDIVPFIKYKMDIQKTESIVEIVVGPSASQNAENGVRTLIRPFHDNADSVVVRSDIPYRAF